MAERRKHLEKTLQNKRECLSYESNPPNTYFNISPRSESSTLRKDKTGLKPSTSNVPIYSHSVGRQKKTEMESLHAITTPISLRASSSRMKQNSATRSSCSPSPVKTHAESFSPREATFSRMKKNIATRSSCSPSPVKTHAESFSTREATFSRMKQNSATRSNCSSSPVRTHAESYVTDRETNNFCRLAHPPKQFIPSSENVIFFKKLWERIVSRYPEWVQRIWRAGPQEQMGYLLHEASKRQIEDKTSNDTGGTEESSKDAGNELTPISEEDHLGISSFHSVSATEASNTMDDENEYSTLTHDVQRRRLLERNSLEISKVCDQVIEWKEWSLQLTFDGKLIITGKSEDNMVTKSRDVSSWERVDARTLRHRKDGTTYKLVGVADHFVCQDLPSYVRTKFQYGFPENWMDIKKMWMKYRREGNPSNFVWSPDTDYNKVKPRLNRTVTGSSTTEIVWKGHRSISSDNLESLKSKMQPVEQNVFENQEKTPLAKRDAMKDLSNMNCKRPVHEAYSFSVPSSKAVNEAATQKSISPKKGSTKETSKKLKTSKTTKNEPQMLKNWYPLLSGKGLKFSGILDGGQSNIRCTTSIVVKVDARTKTVNCTSGERYQLIGDLEASACAAPEFIKTKFKTGIPYRWKMVVKDWIEAKDLLQHSHSPKEQENAESDSEDEDLKEVTLESLASSGKLKKSKRGRIIVPPLQHWLGNPAHASQDSWT